MAKDNWVGPISLGCMASGFVATQALMSGNVLTGPGMQVIAMGFEAGTVGALADWYAVEALFRKLGPHSDILRRKRGEIEHGIVDMVQNQWLAPATIRQHIERFSPSQMLVEYFDKPEHQKLVMDFLRQALAQLVQELDRPALADYLEQALKQQLKEMDLSRPLGRWMQSAIQRGDHHSVWDGLLGAVEENVQSRETRALLQRLIREAVLSYLPRLVGQLKRPELTAFIERNLKEKLQSYDLARPLGGWLVKTIESGGHEDLLNSILENLKDKITLSPEVRSQLKTAVGDALAAYKNEHPIKGWIADKLIDKDDAAKSVALALSNTINDIRYQAENPVRREFNQFLLVYSQQLASGDPATAEAANKLKSHLVQNADWGGLISQFLGWVGETVQSEMQSSNPQLRLVDYEALGEMVSTAVTTLVREIRQDSGHPLRAKLDGLIKNFADRLAAGDADTSAFVERFKAQFIEHADLRGIIGSLLSRFKTEMAYQLNTLDTPLMGVLDRLMRSILNDLRSQPETQAKVDTWMRQAIIELVETHHAVVGDMVRSSLGKLSDDELVLQIKGKVWGDLQFIRLNGAVVGFIVGLLLAGVKQLSGW